MRNKVVIITGSTSSVGAATVAKFAWSGANVVLADRDGVALERQQDFLGSTIARPLSIRTDITDLGSLQALFHTTVRRFGVIDVLVNCAGVLRRGSLDTVTHESIREQIHMNVLGTIYSTQLLLPIFYRQHKGCFIHVVWQGGTVPLPLQAPYAATVGAVRSFCSALSLELTDTPISVSIVCADSTTLIGGTADTQAPKRWPGRDILPRDVARVVVQATRRPRREVHVSRVQHLIARLACFSPRLSSLMHTSLGRRAREYRSDTESSHR